MSEDRYVGTISKHEMVVDRLDYEDGDQKARAWDALYKGLLPPDDDYDNDTEENYELREKMESYLKSCK